MATTKKTRVTKKKISSPLLDRLPKNQEEYLELLIRVSERSITSQGSSIDDFFTGQAARLKKKLADLRGK